MSTARALTEEEKPLISRPSQPTALRRSSKLGSLAQNQWSEGMSNTYCIQRLSRFLFRKIGVRFLARRNRLATDVGEGNA